jgi:RNA-directed DNA polymerase
VASPLLANVALHGMELYLWGRFPQAPPTVIRYADDVVLLHSERAVIEAAQQALSEWLSRMGLELKPEKTHICHTLSWEGGRPGFDFLGFTVRQFPVGKHHTARNRGGPLGWKLFITPSKAAGKEHQRRLKAVIRKHRSAPQGALIAELNPMIRGWCLYYHTVVSARAFKRQDHLTYLKLRRWGKRRHHQGQAWRRYFGPDWRFQAASVKLCKHTDCRIQRHVKVQGRRSPYDGDWVYWSTRGANSPTVSPQVARLLRRQKGKCAACGLYFQVGDLLENDHIVPKHLGGANHDANRQLLHRHCHDAKGAHDKGQATEEPCTGKLVRTVLNERRAGRPARRL